MNKLPPKDIEHNTSLLIEASQQGDINAVKRLIPVSDPQANDSEVLAKAAEYGHTECVKLLIPVSNPKANDSEALRYAAFRGYTKIVKLLLPVSDPKTNNSWALRGAAMNGHTECVKLLIPVSDYKYVWINFQNNIFLDSEMFKQCIEEYEALQLKERLNNKLNGISSVKTNFNKRKI